MKKIIMTTIMAGLLGGTFAHAMDNDKIVVAHRGASGYLPEHSIAAKAMAYAMHPDYIEQDVVMTKDNQLVVLHDHYLDRVTNVAKLFPDRKREDGRYYAIDFTLPEIKQLSMTEGFSVKEGKTIANFSGRFPIWQSSFKVSTLQEEIELIQGLNKSLGYNIGLYPEIKAPWFHLSEGKDISRAVLEVLKEYGYTNKEDKVYLQTFDFNELKRIHDTLEPSLDMDLNLVQLIAETSWNETMEPNKEGKLVPYSYDWMFKPGAMQIIAKYADGVGPWKPMVVSDNSTKDNIILTGMVAEAHKNGMKVHPYTFRNDEGRIPHYADNFNAMLDIFYNTADVDGVFTDFPDMAVEYLSHREDK